MSETPQNLPLGAFLRNASALLDATAGDAQGLQAHLAEFMRTAPDDAHHSMDLRILQSLDRMTQILADLSAAFRATAQGVSETPVQGWPAIAAQLKMEDVGQALTHGRQSPASGQHIELF